MKRFVGILSVFLLIINLIGCNQYTRDDSSGHITEVTLPESLNLANQTEETIILYTVSTCDDCKKLKEVLEPYLENHSIEINEVILDNEGTSDEEIQNNRRKINTIFKEFNAVPAMYYLKDGEVIDEAIEITTEKELEEWVLKNKLDKK